MSHRDGDCTSLPAADTPVLELDGRWALVTGASTGIGRAIAWELAAAGANVLVHARARADALRDVRDRIRAGGRAAELLLADLAERREHEALVAQAWKESGGVDIWVNNAGADVLTGEAANWSFEEKLDRLWSVDVVATMRLARMAGQRMRARGGEPVSGVILNIGWDQAEQGMAGDSGEVFAAVKGAVMAFSRSLAKSLAPEVRVNCIAPGWIKTGWGERASEYWQQRACRESLLGRWGTPDDVAHVARFLASPAAQFITGQVVHVNGGFKSGSA